MQAIESLGFDPSGRLLALNSYENRVYRVELEDGTALVAKFYRPLRWTNEAILEEHSFSQQLADAEIPVVPPLLINDTSLHTHDGYRFALFPLQGGRWPDLEQRDDLLWMGRFLGRIHAVGAQQPFAHREQLGIDNRGEASCAYLLEHDFIPGHLVDAYQSLTRDLLSAIRDKYQQAGTTSSLRLHGDCHRGNILWTDDGPHFVDFDDCISGPAIQDLWMLLAGEREEMQAQLGDILDGYADFADINLAELHLVEALRSLRMMHYAAWLARRWEDPAFPQAFPWFNSTRYWEEHILELREQLARMQEPVLVV